MGKLPWMKRVSQKSNSCFETHKQELNQPLLQFATLLLLLLLLLLHLKRSTKRRIAGGMTGTMADEYTEQRYKSSASDVRTYQPTFF
jgi:hypothetical protein